MARVDGARGAVEQQAPRRARFATPPHAAALEGPQAGTAHDRRELPDDPDSIAHLAYLADLRDACVARPHWPGSIPRYWSAVEASPLREQLEWSELDDLVSMGRAQPPERSRERVVRGHR